MSQSRVTVARSEKLVLVAGDHSGTQGREIGNAPRKGIEITVETTDITT